MSGEAALNVTIEAAISEAHVRYAAANPKSHERHRAASRVMPGGNTRTVLFHPPFPLTIARAEGAHVWDVDGHRYADFQGDYSAGLYGHSNPVIRAAIEEALEAGIVLGGHNKYEARLAEAIRQRFPSIELVRFCNSGTEANLMALGTARAITGRGHVLAFEGAYHGGVLSYGHGGSALNAPFSTVLGLYNDTQATLELIERHARDLAAIIIEPMMGAAGCIPGEAEFLRAVAEAARGNGSVLIFDEVMTSRLAPGGLQQAVGVRPDLTTLGKYLGGGLAFGAFGGRAEIMERFDPRRPDAFPHAGTLNNNVLTMRAGLAGLSEVFTAPAAARLNGEGERLRARLNALAVEHGLPFQVTGIGSLMNVHINARPIRAPADTDAGDGRLLELFHLDMLAHGQYLASRGYMALSLPMGDGEYDGLAAAIEEFLLSRASLISA